MRGDTAMEWPCDAFGFVQRWLGREPSRSCVALQPRAWTDREGLRTRSRAGSRGLGHVSRLATLTIDQDRQQARHPYER
jgi:hypothetical protein